MKRSCRILAGAVFAALIMLPYSGRSVRAELRIDLPRPRTVDMLTSDGFITLKRRVMDLIREEALRAMEASPVPLEEAR